ncbi:MAG: transcriptional regulator, MarR family [Myxococcaceae bacterium]|nr:transcriptional regulator, MarR family [Myxococcaceae bacterium]
MDGAVFRDQMRALMRALGVFDEARTPCGVDISVREAFALGVLLRSDEASRLTHSDLQRALSVDKSNITRLVQQLVNSGMVEQRVGVDERVRTLHLTAKGRKLAGRLNERSVERFRAVLTKVPRDERRNLLRAVDLLRKALEDVAQEQVDAR